MPRLILFHPSDGSIIDARNVNGNHASNHMTEELYEQFGEAVVAKDIGAVLVDDHVVVGRHRVHQADGSIAIISKDETRLALTEPIENLRTLPRAMRELPSGGPVQIEYVAPPADTRRVKLEHGITVYLPIVGRWHCLTSLLRAVYQMDQVNEVPVHVVVHDNSLDNDMGRVLRRYLDSAADRFASTTYHRDLTPQSLVLPDLAYRTAAVYHRAVRVCDTYLIMTIEDDVIPRKDAMARLYMKLIATDNKCAAVAAEVCERREVHTMAWRFGEDGIRYVGDGTTVDAVSFSCTLFRTRPLKSIGIIPKYGEMPPATDIALFSRLHEMGFYAIMDWGLACPHVEPTAAAMPGHPGKIVARRPDTKVDALAFLSEIARPIEIDLTDEDVAQDDEDLPVTNPHWNFEYLGEPIEVPRQDGPCHLSVGMTVRGLPKVTQRCVETLLDTTEGIGRHIMLWDNDSDRETKYMLRQLAQHNDVELITNETNDGYIRPNNVMAHRARGNVHIIANNDLVFHGRWFEGISQAFQADPKLGAVGGPPGCGFLDETMHGRPGEGEPDYIEGYLIAIPRQILLRYGDPFDGTHLQFATAEDSDLSLRLKELGWNIRCLADLPVEHLPHTTRESDPTIGKEMDYTEGLNKAYMRMRWTQWNRTRHFRKHRVLVIREGAKGDLLTLEPVFKGIRWQYPHSHITLKTYKGWIDLMDGCPHFDWIVDHETDVETDAAIDLTNAIESGLNRPKTEWVCNQFGFPISKPSYWMKDTGRPERDRPLCVIHCHAGWIERCWSDDKWRELVGRLTEKYDVVQVAGTDPWDKAVCDGDHYEYCELPPYQELATLLHGADLVIGVDSFVLQLAMAVGSQKCVGLFGPTRQKMVFPWHVAEVIADKPPDCLGCYHQPPFPKERVDCKKDSLECMDGIGVEQIMEKIEC